jgi:(p)ppGpp synthase/HD superfamily hydrolase
MLLSLRYSFALAYAAEAHAQQTRKGTDIPYISHLLAVSGLVLEHGGTEDEAIAALLHDAVEDQGGLERLAEIREKFGETVANIVAGCTDDPSGEKAEWRSRKERYIAHLPDADPSVLLVSCSDKTHNARAIVSDLRALGDALFERFRAGKEGTLWYYRSLADVFLRCGPARLAEELDRVVREMRELACGPVRDLRAGSESERLVTP